jgi:hypothetical protein
MKKLLYFIIFLLILIGGALFALYDNSGDENMPTELYTDDYDAMTMLFTELDNSMTDVENGTSQDLVLNVNQDIVNRAIYEQLLEQNEEYQPGSDCTTDAQCYVISGSQDVEGTSMGFRLIGTWVTFHGPETSTDLGKFVLHVYGGFALGSLEYKTEFEAHFKFDDTDESYYLEFDKFMVGKVPLPKKMFTTVISILENQASLDIEGELEAIPYGEVDIETLTYTLDKSDILAEVESDGTDTGNKLTSELLSIIFANQLVEFELKDEEITLTAGVSQFRSEDVNDIPAYLYDLHDKTTVGTETVIGEYNPELFNPTDYLQDIFTQYIFSSSLVGGGFEINEEIFNKLIYASQAGFAETRKTQVITLSNDETKEIELGLKAIWFEFDENDIIAHALFRIVGINSLLEITAHKDEVLSDGTQLYFEFTNITFGEDNGEDTTEYIDIVDLQPFKELFADLGDVEFGEFNTQGDLVITTDRLSTLLQDGSSAGVVEVTGLSLKKEALVLDVEASSTLQTTLSNFQSELSNAMSDPQLLTNLQEILNETDGGIEEAVYQEILDLQNTLNNPLETVDTVQVEEFFDTFTDLDTGTQSELLGTIGELIDSGVYDQFNSSFTDFTQGDEGTGN